MEGPTPIFKDEGARTPTEEALLVTELETIQDFLCAKVNGEFGNETRSAIRVWQGASGFRATGTLDEGRQARVLLDYALQRGRCDQAIYLNANERLNLANPIALEDFRAKLADLDFARNLGMDVPESVGSIQELRGAIEKAGRELRVDTAKGVTFEFQERLDVAVPEQLPPPAPQ